MEMINVSSLQQDTIQKVNEVVNFNSSYNIATENGNAILISFQEYETLKEMEFFYSRPKLVEELTASMHAPDEEFISEGDFEW